MIVERETKPLCSSCRRREAVYRRLTSGEKLCRLCLFSATANQVRKAVHYYKMLKRGDSIIFILRPDKPLLSLQAFLIFHTAVRDMELKYSILCLKDVTNCELVEHIVKSHVKKSDIEIVSIPCRLDCIKTQTFIHMIKYCEALAIRVAMQRNMNAVIAPLFRDELSMIMLAGLLIVSKTAYSEGMPLKLVEGIKVARPFYYVFSVDVLYLTLTSPELREKESICEPHLNLYIVNERFDERLKSTFIRSPELMYSSIKGSQLLQSYILAGSKRCRICGAYSDKDVCEYCEALLPCLSQVELS